MFYVIIILVCAIECACMEWTFPVYRKRSVYQFIPYYSDQGLFSEILYSDLQIHELVEKVKDGSGNAFYADIQGNCLCSRNQLTEIEKILILSQILQILNRPESAENANMKPRWVLLFYTNMKGIYFCINIIYMYLVLGVIKWTNASGKAIHMMCLSVYLWAIIMNNWMGVKIC